MLRVVQKGKKLCFWRSPYMVLKRLTENKRNLEELWYQGDYLELLSIPFRAGEDVTLIAVYSVDASTNQFLAKTSIQNI